MPSLKGTETEQNLNGALAGEIQAIRPYRYFARKADVEGFDEVADGFETLARVGKPHAGRFQKVLGAP
jgi:rubrerythrin